MKQIIEQYEKVFWLAQKKLSDKLLVAEYKEVAIIRNKRKKLNSLQNEILRTLDF